MKIFTVHTKSYNDISDGDSMYGHAYGHVGFHPNIGARDARDAAARIANHHPAIGITGVVETTDHTFLQAAMATPPAPPPVKRSRRR